MIKVYGVPSCPDCVEVAERTRASNRENEFEIISIGKRMAYLKAPLRLRDREETFRPVREGDYVGIPCSVREDGTMPLDPAEFGL